MEKTMKNDDQPHNNKGNTSRVGQRKNLGSIKEVAVKNRNKTKLTNITHLY